MDSSQIVDALAGVAPDGAIEVAAAADGMPAIYVAREHVAAVCLALRDRPELGFSFAPEPPTRSLARRFAGALRSRGSLAALVRIATQIIDPRLP